MGQKKSPKISNLVDEELYKKVSLNDLIVFGIYSVIEKNEKCTFESLIKECFILFPKAFNFSRIKEWPDARKLDRPLRSLRKENKISGTPQTFFSLTKTGGKRAEDLAKIFRQGKLQL